MKKYILLDWDGNLAKTLDVWLHVCRTFLEKRDLHFSDAKIASCFGATRERFEEWGITDIEPLLKDMHIMASELLPNVELYPDALEVLERLKENGKETALVTTSYRSVVLPLLDKYNIHQYFDAVVTAEDTKRHKPHPEPLEKALEMLGGTKAEAVMIGDSAHDIGAANNAEIDSILFYPPEHTKFYQLEDLQKLHPTHIVEDFRQIIDIVS